MNIPEKIILNNPLNWILSWNEWITQFLNRYLPFLMISPLFCLFWTLFGQFLGTFPIRPVLIIPWLLNWIIFWIESPEFILNWIIFWIESWVKQYWIEYWMNHFLAKERLANPTIIVCLGHLRFRICVAKGGRGCFRPSYEWPKFTLVSKKIANLSVSQKNVYPKIFEVEPYHANHFFP